MLGGSCGGGGRRREKVREGERQREEGESCRESETDREAERERQTGWGGGGGEPATAPGQQDSDLLLPRGPHALCTPRASSNTGLLPFQTLPPPHLCSMFADPGIFLACGIAFHGEVTTGSPSLGLYTCQNPKNPAGTLS